MAKIAVVSEEEGAEAAAAEDPVQDVVEAAEDIAVNAP